MLTSTLRDGQNYQNYFVRLSFCHTFVANIIEQTENLLNKYRFDMKQPLWIAGMMAALMVGCNNRPVSIDEQVDALYDKMPMEERVAQLRSG